MVGGEVAKPRPWEYAFSTKALSKHGFTRMSRKDPKYWKTKVNDETSLDSFGMLRLRQKNLGADSRISS